MRYRPLFCVLSIAVLATLIGGCAAEGPEAPGGAEAPETSADASDPWAGHTHGLTFVRGYEAGKAQVQSTGKPGFFFVTTTWCGPCKRLASENFTDAEVRALLDEFVLVLVDGDHESEALRELNVEGFPHVILMSPELEKLDEVVGYRSVDQFKPRVQSALEQARGQTGTAS